jgi:pimeloyl-ACP methyl ester carboxylesterase
MSRTILLIHGAWLNAASWAGFKARYEAKGYTVLAPNWPHDERSPVELRASPHPDLAKNGVRAILAHYERIIRSLSDQPIIIGHSAGAVFTQVLLDRGFGAAGVAIDPGVMQGAPFGPHAILSALPALTAWAGWRRALHMSRKFFRTRFAQTLPADQQNAAYDRYIVPTAGRLYWSGIFDRAAKVRWANPDRAPLLLIGGGKDLIADANMTTAIYKRQKRAGSPTELKIYPDRSHWTCLDKGWEEIADYALDWAARHARDTRLTQRQAWAA